MMLAVSLSNFSIFQFDYVAVINSLIRMSKSSSGIPKPYCFMAMYISKEAQNFFQAISLFLLIVRLLGSKGLELFEAARMNDAKQSLLSEGMVLEGGVKELMPCAKVACLLVANGLNTEAAWV